MLDQQLVVALPPPSAKRWQQGFASEHGRTRLLCVVHTQGAQAANVGKQIVAQFLASQAFSSEDIYNLLRNSVRQAKEVSVDLRIAVLTFRGVQVSVGTYQLGVGLRRVDALRPVVAPADSIQMREGQANPDDAYAIFSEVTQVQAETVLSQTNAQSLVRVWQEVTQSPLFTLQPHVVLAVLLPPAAAAPLLALNSTQSTADSVVTEQVAPADNTQLTSAEKQAGKVAGVLLVVKHAVSRSLHGVSSRKGLRKQTQLNASSSIAPVSVVDDQPSTNQHHEDQTVEETNTVPDTTKSVRTESSLVEQNQGQSLTAPQQPPAVAQQSAQKTRPSTVVVGKHMPQRKKLLLFFGILIGVAIIIGLVVAVKGFGSQQQGFTSQLEPYSQQLLQIQAVVETDPVAAKEQSQALLETLGNLKDDEAGNKSRVAAVDALLLEVRAVYDAIQTTTQLETLPLFEDLRNISPAFVASYAAGTNGQSVFIDKDQQLLIRYDLTAKQGELVEPTQLLAPAAAAASGTNGYILSDGVLALPATGAAELSEVIASGDATTQATLLAQFDGNLYVLNPSKRALYRYVPQGSTFASPKNWLSGAVPFTLSDAVGLAVDGQVWLTTKNGAVYKFDSGSNVEFALTGLQAPLTSSVYVAAVPDDDRLFLLEPNSKRVIVATKDGIVQREFIHPVLGSATALFFDTLTQQLYIVSGASVYALAV